MTSKTGEIDARDVCRVLIGKPEGQPEVYVRVGRYGPFLEQGERRASIPEQTPPDEIVLETALKMLETSTHSEEPLGTDADGKPVFLKMGRFGPYVQRGHSDDDEKPQNASLLKGMQPEDVTLDVALKLLTLPRTLGVNPGIASGRRLQRPLWTLRKVRREGDPLASGGRFTAGCHIRAGPGAFGAAESGRPRPRCRKTRTAQGLRSLAGDQQSGAITVGPLRPLCDRRRNQRLASPRNCAGRGDA